MIKKKLLFTAYSLGLGGIEKALVNLLNRLDYKKYDVTLILEKKEGIFLEQIPKEVKVVEYKISDNKIVILRKIYNRLKLIKWQSQLKNKYDFSCSFCTYSIPGAYLALVASSNNALWMHGNYYILYKEKMKDFLDGIMAKNFKNVVFVSHENKRDVCSHYEGLDEKAIVCNNYIDGANIFEKAKDKVEYIKEKNIPLFVNVGRHEEHQKRLSRIIEASAKLKKENYKFRILFIGDGPDTGKYKEQVIKAKLSKNIIFLGRKSNPYPYYKMCDAVLLASDYEGFPVVFLEAMMMNKVILSTKVSDWEELDGENGLFCDFSTEAVYKMMKQYLDNGFAIKKKFDYIEYNKDIDNKINDLIKGKASK